MRNFGSSKNTAAPGGMLSVEKFHHVSSEQYSVEEAEVELAEAQDAAAEVEATSAELAEAQEVAGSLEDIEGLITEGEPLTEREANLVAVAGDLAFAGTVDPVEPMVPEAAMESYRAGGRASFENRVVDAIKEIWRYIKQALAKAWKKIKEFYSKYFGPVKKLEKDFEALKKRATALAGSSKVRDGERNFELTSGVSTLCVDYKAITNGAELLKHGENYTKLLKSNLSSDTANAGRALLEGINNTVSGFDPEDASAGNSIDTLAAVFEHIVKNAIKTGLTKTNLQNAGDYEFYSSGTVFGNRAQCVRVHKNVFSGKSAFKTAKELETLNKTMISFREVMDHATKEKPTECSFTILTGSQMEDLCDQAIEWTRLLQSYATGRAVADMEKERSRLEKATDALEARFTKYENRSNAASATTGVSVALYRQFVALNTVALNMVASPTVSLQKHALGVMAAYRHIIKASLSRYE